jgi:hypothetical protein
MAAGFLTISSSYELATQVQKVQGWWGLLNHEKNI